MARITLDDVVAWIESSKLPIQALDLDHASQIEEEILARISSAVDTSTWLDKASTPRLIQVIIAKSYAGWCYDKYYSENQNEPNKYAELVKQNAEMLIQGIIDGTITVPGTVDGGGAPVYYPNDASSAQSPTALDPSLGPAIFSMGLRF